MKPAQQEQAQQVILVPLDLTANSGLSQNFQSGSFVPMLMYGGVAVAVILAMAYFSQLQFKGLANIVKIVTKKIK